MAGASPYVAGPPDMERHTKLGPVGMTSRSQASGPSAAYPKAERDTVWRGHNGRASRVRADASPALRHAITAGGAWHASLIRRHG